MSFNYKHIKGEIPTSRISDLNEHSYNCCILYMSTCMFLSKLEGEQEPEFSTREFNKMRDKIKRYKDRLINIQYNVNTNVEGILLEMEEL